MEFYPQLDGYVLVAVTWDNCDTGPTQPSLIVARAAELGDLALVRDYKFSAYGEEHLALYVREVREHVRCTACGEVVEVQEPCACVFEVVGMIDNEGFLHTARRIAQYGQDWPGVGAHGEMAYRRINRADPGYEPVYSSRFACGVCGQMTAYTEFDCPGCGASLF